MDPLNYYVTTLTNAFTKLAPLIGFLIGGYFVFVKLPFLFLKKSLDEQKKGLDLKEVNPKKIEIEKKINLENKKNNVEDDFLKREKFKDEKKQSIKREDKTRVVSPEEVLGFRVNESFTMSELKKRYFEKLKENHPDRVASMGDDFKKLAEMNTKEINVAYDKLKKRAA